MSGIYDSATAHKPSSMRLMTKSDNTTGKIMNDAPRTKDGPPYLMTSERQNCPVDGVHSCTDTHFSEATLVAAVAAGKKHRFSKEIQNTITLLAGLGVEGDAHCGTYVQHLYDRAQDPTRPNLRQVHLVEQELLEHLARLGFALNPGQLGENSPRLVSTCLCSTQAPFCSLGQGPWFVSRDYANLASRSRVFKKDF